MANFLASFALLPLIAWQVADGASAAVLGPTPWPGYPGPNKLAGVPPMGWMSWERYRCNIDCAEEPNNCINEALYMRVTDSLVADGYVAAGYDQVSVDDCWANMSRAPDGRMFGDRARFPSGMKALGDYMHSKGVRFGIYSDAGETTCKHYPGSMQHETVDADTFASWGVDFLKLDGCDNRDGPNGTDTYARDYPAMGAALQQSGRNITYSCSWPAYLGNNETAKPWARMVAAGCNTWRNWHDISNSYASIAGIITYFGEFSRVLATAAGPGHWNDMDQIMAGNDHCMPSGTRGTNANGGPECVLPVAQVQTQLAIWSIMASPLIMSNNPSTISATYRAILQNKEMIRVHQDAMAVPGYRVSPPGFPDPAMPPSPHPHPQPPAISSWARQLEGGDIALAFFNFKSSGNDGDPSSDDAAARPTRASDDACQWNHTVNSFADGPNIVCKVFPNAVAAQDACCAEPRCMSASYTPQTSVHRPGFGCLKSATTRTGSGADGYRKVGPGPGPSPSPSPSPPQSGNATISVRLSDLGFAVDPAATFTVLDIWAGTHRVGLVRGSDTVVAKDVPVGSTTFLRLTKTKGERDDKGV